MNLFKPMKLKSSSIALLLAGLAVFVFFFILKCLHFHRCDYTSDILSHFQLSHDWLIGKPLFYENCFGYHNKIHNYFIDLLLSPFTWIFGVYGLFVALFGLLMASFYVGLKLLDHYSAPFETKLLLFVFYGCPLSFYIFHNEHYGFHVETLLIPLLVLFCAAYLRGNKWYMFWALLVVLVKEDAVIALWSCLMILHFRDFNLNMLSRGRFFRKVAGSSLLCLLIFIIGLLWLKYMNNWDDTRSGDIIETFRAKPLVDLKNSFGYLIAQRVQLTVLIVFVIYVYAGWRYTLVAVSVSVPILLVNLLAGLTYSADGDAGIKNVFSVMWVPRLSMYWAYWLSVVFIALTYKPALCTAPSRFLRLSGSVCFGILLFGSQMAFFLRCEVTHFDTMASIKYAFEPPFKNEGFIEFPIAANIAEHLPEHYPVAVMDRVFGAFHRQDIIWNDQLNMAWYKPRMILKSYRHDEVPVDITRVMKHPVSMLYRERLLIYCELEDTSYVSKAGIHGTWIDQTLK